MNQTQLRRLLSALGDAAEATTWATLRDAVLASAVATVRADSALVTEDQQFAFERLPASKCDHQAAFAVVVDSRHRMCVAVNRSRRDFSADDMAGLDALRRLLTACAVRVVQLERLTIDCPESPATLSRRENDVLSLVASGLTDDQVGRRLGISGRTVNKHLEHIYQKTGMRNRTQAAGRWHQLHAAGAIPEQREGRA